RRSAIVHEHEFRIDARLVAEVIVCEQAGRLALVRALIEVVRREVELVRGGEPTQRVACSDRKVAGNPWVGGVQVAVDDEARDRGSARAAAAEVTRSAGGTRRRQCA